MHEGALTTLFGQPLIITDKDPGILAHKIALAFAVSAGARYTETHFGLRLDNLSPIPNGHVGHSPQSDTIIHGIEGRAP